MEITLPKRLNGSPFTINENKRLVTVVGANGSGKTRFVNQMVAEAGERAFRLSVIDALYPTKSDNTVNSVSKQYLQTVTNSPLVRANADTEFDMLLCLLAFDEMADLLSFKLENANTEDDKQKQLPVTKIDILIKLWTTIFPKSTILRSHGLIKIQNDVNKDPFNPFKMSHGEKAVFYYIGASLYAPKNSVIFVDSPTLFLHPSITQGLWNTIEDLRPDCTFVYQTHDVEFSASRSNNLTIWVRHFDIVNTAWDYEIMQPHAALSEQLILDILGTRKPVLFVEGDDTHSIDFKLYSLIFPDYTVKSMGSCNKVIETVRSFNDMATFHHLDSWGIVDRDRRTPDEVKYLRNKKILVPNVAEIENIMLLEGVVRAVARQHKKDEIRVFAKVRKGVMDMFRKDVRKQALMHTRHRVKRTIEYIVDRRFHNISELEQHVSGLIDDIKPRAIYEQYCRDFNVYLQTNDYQEVLRVYNEKSMLINTDVAQMCGLKNKEEYISSVLSILRKNGKNAEEIRKTIKKVFEIFDNE